MFNEITGSLSILAKFSVKETKDSTIDEVLLSARKSNVSNSINFNTKEYQNKHDISYEHQNMRLLNDSTINDPVNLSEDGNNLPYKYAIRERRKEIKNSNRAKIRINSLSPISINSSAIENEYDIIRDDIGYSHLVGKIFYYSIRSNNSSKYVSDESKLK